MSLNFNNPVPPEAKELIEQYFGEKVAAEDGKTFLLNDLDEVVQEKMKEIANAAKQPAVMEFNAVGDVKVMADGSCYRVTAKGWVKE